MWTQSCQRGTLPATARQGGHGCAGSPVQAGAGATARLASRRSGRECLLLRPVAAGAAAGGAAGGSGAAASSGPAPATGAGPAGASAASPASAPDMTLEPFKSLVAGRRFSCTMCGKCCTGDGEIWLGPDEIPRMAKFLNMSTQRFLDTYTKQYSKYKGWRMLKTAGDSGQSCVFLNPLDGKTCLVHAVRPSQCSTYPWWPELMHDGEWEWEKANICEGFDHPEAPPLDVEEAARQLKEANTMTQLRLLASTVRVTPKEMDWANRVLVWEEEEDEDGNGDGSAGHGRVEGAAGGKAPQAKGKQPGQGKVKGK